MMLSYHKKHLDWATSLLHASAKDRWRSRTCFREPMELIPRPMRTQSCLQSITAKLPWWIKLSFTGPSSSVLERVMLLHCQGMHKRMKASKEVNSSAPQVNIYFCLRASPRTKLGTQRLPSKSRMEWGPSYWFLKKMFKTTTNILLGLRPTTKVYPLNFHRQRKHPSYRTKNLPKLLSRSRWLPPCMDQSKRKALKVIIPTEAFNVTVLIWARLKDQRHIKMKR